MTDIFADFRRLVVAAVEDLIAAGALPQGLDLDRIAVEPPRDPEHGDLASNAAMALAGWIAAALAGRALVTGDYRGHGFAVEPAAPGFLNIRLAPEVWHAQ